MIIEDNTGVEIDIPIEVEIALSDAVENMLNRNVVFMNYPNPFNPTTTIFFVLQKNIPLTELSIYNLKGKKIKTLVNEHLNIGRHSVVWDGKDDNGKHVSSGMYFYRLKTDRVINKKMVLLK